MGSGPNGLAAAILLARHGVRVRVLEAAETPGGGLRTAESTLPGFRHDVCAAIHPMAAAGWVFDELGIDVTWRHPEVLLAHPLDDGSAGVLMSGIEDTVAANGSPRWARYFRPIVDNWDRVTRDVLGPSLRIPRAPVLLGQLGIRALPPATLVSRWLGSPRAAALFVGIAAHTNTNLGWPMSASGGLGLAAAGHVGGWPCAQGGTQAIADAMVARLTELGGVVECGQKVSSLASLAATTDPGERAADAIVFDLTPWQVAQIAGDELPARTPKAWRRFRRGSGVFKLDYALAGPVPWTNAEARRAGTVHLGGTWQEVATAEAQVRAGRVAEKPFVLVAQQSLLDSTRAPAGRHTLWAYCHVPPGCTRDVTNEIEAQIDRFAPGWRDLVLARSSMSPAALEAYNPNYIGGSIDGGASELHRVLLRPDISADPYRIGDTNMWLCSSSTPPGAGVHGMCGAFAAESVLRSFT